MAGTDRAFCAIAAHNHMILTCADAAVVGAASSACVDSHLIDADATGRDAECSTLYLVAVGRAEDLGWPLLLPRRLVRHGAMWNSFNARHTIPGSNLAHLSHCRTGEYPREREQESACGDMFPEGIHGRIIIIW